MGVVIESVIWEPNKSLYVFLFISSVLSIFCLPVKSVANVFDQAPPASFLRFRRKFLLLFAISSVMQGLWAAFGEYELAYYGFSREQMLEFLSVGFAVSMFIGSFLGMLSDLLGHKKLCLLFYMLHLSVSVCKIVIGTPTIWLTSIFLSLASSIFSFSFETWMVVEHEKLGQRQESLNDMFWLMTFSESASFIGSQAIANYMIDGNGNNYIGFKWTGAALLAVVAIIYVTQGLQEAPQTAALKDYRASFHRLVSDKRIWLLLWAQACIHFSVAAFWILWAPTIVADGREVSLGLIYPCLVGSKMLGSTGFPWFFHRPLVQLRIEEYLIYAFIIMGLALSVVAYDYQEIGVLVALLCLFQTCTGVVLPSLAKLRTMYVPNEIRGGIMSLSLMPANAAILFLLVLRGEHQWIGNSTIIASAAVGLFSAAGCMYFLRKWEKQPRHNL